MNTAKEDIDEFTHLENKDDFQITTTLKSTPSEKNTSIEDIDEFTPTEKNISKDDFDEFTTTTLKTPSEKNTIMMSLYLRLRMSQEKTLMNL